MPRVPDAQSQSWLSFSPGVSLIGHRGDEFAFDNETPQHLEYLADFQIFSDLITCRDYLMFMKDGGYAKPTLWLSDGWDTVTAEGWQAPLYWRRSDKDGEWEVFTLHGFQPLASLMNTPVCHLSYYEAEAFAHWAGHRLPTEAEWETAAVATHHPVSNPLTAESLDTACLHPFAQPSLAGSVWQWTQSAYLPYPGYRPLPGALGEYNGKFMSGQMVLRGGSVVSPAGHLRATYRNFFHPGTRWQFSGIRLARRHHATV
jgi:ergothioneine biosynthesis protein EgtB